MIITDEGGRQTSAVTLWPATGLPWRFCPEEPMTKVEFDEYVQKIQDEMVRGS